MKHHEYQLTQGIIALSVAKTWDRAKLEWELEDITPKTSPRPASAAISQSMSSVSCATNPTETGRSSACLRQKIPRPSIG